MVAALKQCAGKVPSFLTTDRFAAWGASLEYIQKNKMELFGTEAGHKKAGAKAACDAEKAARAAEQEARAAEQAARDAEEAACDTEQEARAAEQAAHRDAEQNAKCAARAPVAGTAPPPDVSVSVVSGGCLVLGGTGEVLNQTPGVFACSTYNSIRRTSSHNRGARVARGALLLQHVYMCPSFEHAHIVACAPVKVGKPLRNFGPVFDHVQPPT